MDWTKLSYALAALFLFGTLPFASTSASAQALWTNSVMEDGVALEGRKIIAEGDANLPTSTWMLNVRNTLNDIQLVGELGFSHYSLDMEMPVGDGATQTVEIRETTLSNLYLGAAHRIMPELQLEAGLSIPLVDDETGPAITAGMFTNIDRPNAFQANTWAITGSADYRTLLTDELYLRGRLSPSLGINTTGDDSETDLSTGFALQAWYENPTLRAGLGLNGFSNLTADFPEEVDQTHLGATVSAVAKVGPIEPGLQVQIPLSDNFQDVVTDGVIIGITLAAPLP